MIIFVTHNTFDLTILPTKRRGSSFNIKSPLICREESQIMEMGNFIIIYVVVSFSKVPATSY